MAIVSAGGFVFKRERFESAHCGYRKPTVGNPFHYVEVNLDGDDIVMLQEFDNKGEAVEALKEIAAVVVGQKECGDQRPWTTCKRVVLAQTRLCPTGSLVECPECSESSEFTLYIDGKVECENCGSGFVMDLVDVTNPSRPEVVTKVKGRLCLIPFETDSDALLAKCPTCGELEFLLSFEGVVICDSCKGSFKLGMFDVS